MRRAQPLHPPALLVDQDGSVGAADRITKIINQCTNLVRTADVAIVVSLLAEENQAPWVGLAQERAFLGRYRGSGHIGDEGFDGHRRGLSARRKGVKAPMRRWKPSERASASYSADAFDRG